MMSGSAADGQRHKVVIVGGGAAGLELATMLGRRLGRRGRAAILLVDRARTHLWKPLLHQVAAGSVDTGEHEVDYLAQAHWHGFTFRQGELTGVDRAAKTIRLAATLDEDGREITPERNERYDTLILAVGSVSNDFGTRGVAEHALPLDTVEQAARFNRRIVNACLRAQTQEEAIRPGQLHVAIVGAGATGTELAAQLHQTTRQLIAFGFDRIDPARDLSITLIEAAPRILPVLPERIATATTELLSTLGVDVRAGARVAEIRADGVVLTDGTFIPAELTVWAAGVRGPEVLAGVEGLEVTRSGQLVVEQDLRTTRDPSILAMGDCASCPWPGQPHPVPPRAQAAHQEARHLARELPRLLREAPLRPYVYRDFGSLVSLGEYSTVGNLMGFLRGKSLMIEGFLARMVYLSLYKTHEMALHGPIKVVFDTLARSFHRRTGPQVKLH